jgi:putrescine aminotransferase
MQTNHPAVKNYAKYVNPDFIKLLGILGLGRVYVKAEDVWLWDQQDRRYLDLLAGYGAMNIGYNHPRLLKRMKDALEESLPNLSHIGPPVHAAELAAQLAGRLNSPLQISLFSNSGSEAVEAALKLACAATGRYEFIHCGGSYHGTSLATLSIMDDKRMRGPFKPVLIPSMKVPFGDTDQLRRALKSGKAACFVVEPVQGEGGVYFPPPGYLREAKRLCSRYGTLMILDEVQTGMGRTGSMFAYESEDFVPDVMVLGKSLGGGLAPISVTVTSAAIYKKAYGSMDRIAIHGYTFGGNAFSCIAALETFQIIEDENLLHNARVMGTKFMDGLQNALAGHPLVKEIRGRGLLIGIEIGHDDTTLLKKMKSAVMKPANAMLFGQWLSIRLLEKGIVVQPSAHAWNVLKIEPPLTIGEKEIEMAIETIASVFDEYQSAAQIIKDATVRLGRQFLKEWAFP